MLLHVCCANCLFDVLPALQEEGLLPVLFFYNPNIHPLVEYRRRRKSFLLAAERLSLPVLGKPAASVDPRLFLERVEWREERPRRCAGCYYWRLREAAREAARAGLGGFLSTLQVSGEQAFEALVEAGRRAARESGVDFLEMDLRHRHGWGRPPAGFHPYRQSYCGCLVSEYERYAPTRRHLVRGEGAR